MYNDLRDFLNDKVITKKNMKNLLMNELVQINSNEQRRQSNKGGKRTVK